MGVEWGVCSRSQPEYKSDRLYTESEIDGRISSSLVDNMTTLSATLVSCD
ncbi:MAG: hypothetical protein LBQ66_12170 [Planctomycetaceae bacterium]|jgi:hypothetical protein|nr:hypothetical protein [Planctomycetaceae bacterium]